MKRSPLKRKTELKRKTPMRRRSAKMEAKYAGDDGRRALVKRMLKARPICEAGARIGSVVGLDETRHVAARGTFRGWRLLVWKGCTRKAQDVHEILARSAGGDILDEDNCMPVCRRCHCWIGDHAALATHAGLRKSRYKR